MGPEIALSFREDKKKRVSTKLLFDVQLLVAVIILMIIGLLALYSASWNYSLQAFDSGTYILRRQILMMIAGLGGMTVLANFDYHRFHRISKWAMLFTFLLLAVMLIDFTKTGGYTRTLFSNGSVQPSEVAKLVLIIQLASLLTKKQDVILDIGRGMAPAVFSIVLIALPILFQPDVSTALMIVVLGGVMFFIGGGNARHIAVIIVVTVMVGACAYFLFDKVETRFNEWWYGIWNPAAASYHIQRAINAMLRGGIFGVGIGKGTAKITGLPVAWTDSIFAVILEETGLAGGACVIGLYVWIMLRGYAIFKKATDTFGKLLAAGITFWIVFEAFVNIMVILNLLPFAGNALPLISFGGSSLLTVMAALGILLNISRVSAKQAAENERSTPDAIVDMRRRDWGWRVSRPGSSASRKR